MQYDVPLIPQTSSMSCWAASIAMIRGWNELRSIPDTVIAENAGGPSYMTSYRTGLDPNDKVILRANGFVVEAPECYTVPGISELLRRHGPLWVATWAPGPHIRVISGMSGSTLSIHDPAPVDIGSQYVRPFDRFFGAMETLGGREMGEPSPVYVAHLHEVSGVESASAR